MIKKTSKKVASQRPSDPVEAAIWRRGQKRGTQSDASVFVPRALDVFGREIDSWVVVSSSYRTPFEGDELIHMTDCKGVTISVPIRQWITLRSAVESIILKREQEALAKMTDESKRRETEARVQKEMNAS